MYIKVDKATLKSNQDISIIPAYKSWTPIFQSLKHSRRVVWITCPYHGPNILATIKSPHIIMLSQNSCQNVSSVFNHLVLSSLRLYPLIEIKCLSFMSNLTDWSLSLKRCLFVLEMYYYCFTFKVTRSSTAKRSDLPNLFPKVIFFLSSRWVSCNKYTEYCCF